MVQPERIRWIALRSIVLLGIVAACRIGAARAELPVTRFEVTATAPVVLTIPEATADGQHFLQGGDGWTPLAGSASGDGALQVALPASRAALLLLNRPAWMVMDDATPPAVVSASLGERTLPLADDGGIDVGCLPEGTHRLSIVLEDAHNPIDADSVRLLGADNTEPNDSVNTVVPDGAPRRATVNVTLDCRTPGTFERTLLVADRSATRQVRRVAVRHAVMGIAVSEDRQQVRLSNGRESFLLQPHLSRQLELPNGVWAKLTTNMNGQWLYPREFTDVQIMREQGDARTVRILSSVQSIKGAPVEGLGRIEFVVTVRTDTPALLVTSRSVNVSDKPVPTYANWGWLPGSYYELPAGRSEWRGKAADKYFDVGWPGWLWLAPLREGDAGIGWMSPLKFGESRFDTMLLYSERAMCEPGEGVEIAFAIAVADSAESTRRIAADLVDRGLLAAPEARTAPE